MQELHYGAFNNNANKGDYEMLYILTPATNNDVLFEGSLNAVWNHLILLAGDLKLNEASQFYTIKARGEA